MKPDERERFNKIEPCFSILDYVLKLDSTTLCHPVINASFDEGHLPSLNDMLPQGSSLNKTLSEIILSQTLFKVIGIGDIYKFYNQIQLHEKDWPVTSFWWKKMGLCGPPKPFEQAFSRRFLFSLVVAQCAANGSKLKLNETLSPELKNFLESPYRKYFLLEEMKFLL